MAHLDYGGFIWNKEADTLAKKGTSKECLDASQPHEFAHLNPYFYQRDEWPSTDSTPDKGPIRFLEKHLTKYDKIYKSRINPHTIPQ